MTWYHVTTWNHMTLVWKKCCNWNKHCIYYIVFWSKIELQSRIHGPDPIGPNQDKKIENSRDDRKKSSKKVSIQLVILKWTQTMNELGVVWFGFQKNVDHTENRLNLRWLSIAVCFVGSAAVICANHRLQMFSIAFVLVGNK